MGNITGLVKTSLIDVFRETRISEAEYVLLRLISFFMPGKASEESGFEPISSEQTERRWIEKAAFT